MHAIGTERGFLYLARYAASGPTSRSDRIAGMPLGRRGRAVGELERRATLPDALAMHVSPNVYRGQLSHVEATGGLHS